MKGGQSERKCSSCIRNNIQKEYNCPYIFKDENIDKTITFEAPEVSLEYFTNKCPIWYWNEFNNIYNIIIMYEESNSDIISQPFVLREFIINHKNYIQSVIKYNNKK